MVESSGPQVGDVVEITRRGVVVAVEDGGLVRRVLVELPNGDELATDTDHVTIVERSTRNDLVVVSEPR